MKDDITLSKGKEFWGGWGQGGWSLAASQASSWHSAGQSGLLQAVLEMAGIGEPVSK